MDNSYRAKWLDRFLGSTLGTFVGDALGEPVEGWPHHAIYSRFGLLDTMVREEGRYTDDTQMMIGILETLQEKGGFDPAICADKFQENFEPQRGYGRRIFGVVERIRQGTPWDRAGTDSYGNGGAMRIAPIGCFYHSDPQALKEKAVLSARITHNHPEGVAGAVAQASAVGLALQQGLSNDPIKPESFLDWVVNQVRDVDQGFAKRLEEIRSVPPGSLIELIDAITDRYGLSLRAIESVPASLAAFLLTQNFRDAVVLAVNLGGDTDTIGAMAGAVAGAYYGHDQMPQEWLNSLENGVKGRDYVVNCVRDVVSSSSNPMRDRGVT